MLARINSPGEVDGGVARTWAAAKKHERIAAYSNGFGATTPDPASLNSTQIEPSRAWVAEP